MARDDNTRFRITPWPDRPVPFPDYRSVWPAVLVNDDGSPITDVRSRRMPGSASVYGELYLELASVDLSSKEAIVDFADRHGTLGVAMPDPSEPTIGHIFFYEWEAASEEVMNYLWKCRESIEESAPKGIGHFETLMEFRWGAWALRDMTTAWRIFQGEIEEGEAVWEAPCWASSSNRFALPDDVDLGHPHPGTLLDHGLRMALRPFSPRVTWLHSDSPAATPYGRGSESISLFSICALELFNHMCENAAYRRCANETCGRFFVRQKGRAVHGQHRTSGVKYCSAECARAQAQRAYRRRKRAAK